MEGGHELEGGNAMGQIKAIQDCVEGLKNKVDAEEIVVIWKTNPPQTVPDCFDFTFDDGNVVQIVAPVEPTSKLDLVGFKKGSKQLYL